MLLDTVGLYDLGERYKYGGEKNPPQWEYDLFNKRTTEEQQQHVTDLLLRLNDNFKIIYFPVSLTEDFFEPGIYREVWFADVEGVLGRRRELKHNLWEINLEMLRRNTLFDQVNTLSECEFEEYKIPEDCNGFIATTIVSEFGYGWSCSIVRICNTPWFASEPKAPLFSAAGTGLRALNHIKVYFEDYLEGCTSGPYRRMHLSDF